MSKQHKKIEDLTKEEFKEKLNGLFERIRTREYRPFEESRKRAAEDLRKAGLIK